LVAVRIVGTAPDALLADDLYQSIWRELFGVGSTKDPTTTADGHWTQRLGCQLPKDSRLSILLAGIDRLDSWGLISVDKLPDNVRLIVTCSTSLVKDVRGWTCVQMTRPEGPAQPPTVWSSDPILGPLIASPAGVNDTIDAILTGFFDEVERQYPPDFVHKSCAILTLASGLAGCNSSGLAEDEWRQCLDPDPAADDNSSLQQTLRQLIQSLGIQTTPPFLLLVGISNILIANTSGAHCRVELGSNGNHSSQQ
jgi:hypothetical protein